jgi:hypothetical protein
VQDVSTVFPVAHPPLARNAVGAIKKVKKVALQISTGLLRATATQAREREREKVFSRQDLLGYT